MQRFHPLARDAGVARVTRITVGVVAAGIAATLGLGAAIATAAPPPKAKKEKTDFADDKGKPTKPPVQVKGGQNVPAQPQPPRDRPESSSGDEQTTSGGS
ncbi:MAG TPA: hypothetical protein VGJ95_02150 [Pseudonocardiaceae bacterium]|jgi:hypothetical protein